MAFDSACAQVMDVLPMVALGDCEQNISFILTTPEANARSVKPAVLESDRLLPIVDRQRK